jgi:mannan endo-1,4-beta-mannosidase
MTAPPPRPSAPSPPRSAQPGHRPGRRRRAGVIAACVTVALALIVVGVVKVAGPIGPAVPASSSSAPPIGTFSRHPVRITLPARPESYLGAFVKGSPASYAPVTALTADTGVRPNITLYYSGWYEKFRSVFAVQATDNGAVPFIQIEPKGVNLAAIASGAFDTFLKTFATDVASYGARTGQGVIIGFGHEMNGYWYSWGYGHVPPTTFVAAWRHIVTVFRQQGADDVTWLWTVNVIDTRHGIAAPSPWWPGSSYVTWVGIDGYYLRPSWTFASLFGPTIKAIRSLTLDPILISETGAAPAEGQPAKIAGLFAGVRAYGLLGFVWFDARGTQDWRLSGPAAFAAFRRGAQTLKRRVS